MPEVVGRFEAILATAEREISAWAAEWAFANGVEFVRATVVATEDRWRPLANEVRIRIYFRHPEKGVFRSDTFVTPEMLADPSPNNWIAPMLDGVWEALRT